MIEEFNNWLIKNFITFNYLEDNVYEINEKYYILINYERTFISNTFNFDLLEHEIEIIRGIQSIGKECLLAFKFGTKFYYAEFDEEVKFNDFVYVGKTIEHGLDYRYNHLALHTDYEILSSCVKINDYIKKAKFLEQETLGISDKNTLSGVLPFQLACQKENIKPILGETITVSYKGNKNDYLYDISLIVCSKQGWENLSLIDYEVQNSASKSVSNEFLLNHSEGLICIFGTESILHTRVLLENEILEYVQKYKESFKRVFYALDAIEYKSDNQDKAYLDFLKRYIEKFHVELEPIYFSPSYYLEEYHVDTYEKLSVLSKKSVKKALFQHYKHPEELKKYFESIFESDKAIEIRKTAFQNSIDIVKDVNFLIDVNTHKLPEYSYDGDKQELFLSIISSGLENLYELNPKIEEKVDDYVERLKKEIDVITSAGFVDYFLILWDIVNYAKKNNISVGPGRGSAAGSLILYCMGVTGIDPLSYDLLFERFLNEGRIMSKDGKSGELPDVDIDFESGRRDEIKQYIVDKYGENNVVYVGSFGKLKLKKAIKDLSRAKGLSHKSVNTITSTYLPFGTDLEWSEIFKTIFTTKDKLTKRLLTTFVQDNYDVIEDAKLLLNNISNETVHASAVIITPNKDGDKFVESSHWLPVKKHADGFYQSMWEGEYLSSAGFLKEDILSISQLDKFQQIIGLVKKNRGENIDLSKIPYNDDKVFKLLKRGMSEDVFQFGKTGMQKFLKITRPTEIEDLIAMVALYRPGPMADNAHIKFADIKNKRKKPVYYYGIEDITKNTSGLIIYQEQIMQIAQKLAGFNLSEADNLRKGMGKKKQDIIDKYEPVFIENSVKNNIPREKAEDLWEKMKEFAKYGFNKSHAASYAILAYQSQWLKANYPLEFYTVSLTNTKENEVFDGYTVFDSRLNEIENFGAIRVMPPNINYSKDIFTCNPDKNEIYWSLTKISHVGDSCSQSIIQEREANGNFYSLSEFVTRVDKSKVNKRHIAHLIVSGAFDEVENLTKPLHRKNLLSQYFEYFCSGESLPEQYASIPLRDTAWLQKQKEVCGFGIIDFKKHIPLPERLQYKSGIDIQNSNNGDLAVIAGQIANIKVRQTKKDKKDFAILDVVNNNSTVSYLLWPEDWNKHKSLIQTIKDENMFFWSNVQIKFDEYNQKMSCYTQQYGKTKIKAINI